MGHELRPRAGDLPPPTEVARVLSREFAYVKIDSAKALARARATAEWIERSPATIFLGQHEKALVRAQALKSCGPSDALSIELGDDPSNTVEVAVLRGETIRFAYSGAEDEARAKDLVERCARALDCDVVAF